MNDILFVAACILVVYAAVSAIGWYPARTSPDPEDLAAWPDPLTTEDLELLEAVREAEDLASQQNPMVDRINKVEASFYSRPPTALCEFTSQNQPETKQ